MLNGLDEVADGRRPGGGHRIAAVHSFRDDEWCLGILSVIVIVFAIVLMLYAIKKEKARWIIPHLSAQVFLILFLIIVAIVVAILLLFGAYHGIRNLLGVYDYYMSDDSTFIIGIMIIVIYPIVALLEVFFLIIVWKLYKYDLHCNSY
ncbi:unnamed protein product [Angiostrongylus costaricensis]|uniref:Transmembrane protein 182 n=1 Tax=Angiostrongylus costaricensis TaxID=334426 RepID=A0A158PJT5_ANGCS|nr:unnamed protein product [Angiostrongylus costaricensis]